MFKRVSWLPLSLALVIFGCADGSDLVELRVESAVERATVAGLSPPGSGARFLVVKVTVTNNRRDIPLAIAFPLFSVATDAGLEITASSAGLGLDGACSTDVKVSPSASHGCQLAFPIPQGDLAKRLWYRAVDGPTASVDLTVTTCTFCGDECVDLATSAAHCGACNNKLGSGATCVGGKITCQPPATTLCGTECANLETSTAHCGACDNKLADGTVCKGGKPACEQSGMTLCHITCVNLSTDDRNCGKCDRSCVRGRCNEGKECLFDVAFSKGYANWPTGKSCYSLCIDDGADGCKSVSLNYYAPGGGSKQLSPACTAIPPNNYPYAPYTSYYLNGIRCTCLLALK